MTALRCALTLAASLLLLTGCRTPTAPDARPTDRPDPPTVREVRIERRGGDVHFAFALKPGRLPYNPSPTTGESWSFRLDLRESAEPYRAFELAPQPGGVVMLQAPPWPDFPLVVRPGLVTFAVPESALSAASLSWDLIVYRVVVWAPGERDWDRFQTLSGFEDDAPRLVARVTP